MLPEFETFLCLRWSLSPKLALSSVAGMWLLLSSRGGGEKE